MPITADEVAFYRRNGYVSIENVFDPNATRAMQVATAGFVERSRAVSRSDDVFDLGPDHSPDVPHLRRIKDPEKQHPAYEKAHKDPTVLEILAYLLGPDIRAHSSKLNLKGPGSPTAVEWHQDWAYGGSTNDDILTVGIAINDVTVSNGCLLVVPGSHLRQIWDHYQGDEFVGAVTDPAFDPSGAVPIELKAGSISIHHIRLLHGSAPNTSTVPRHLLLFAYSAADSWPLSGVTDPASYNEQMLRGTPPRAPRLEKVPIGPIPRWPTTGPTTLFALQDRFKGARYRSN